MAKFNIPAPNLNESKSYDAFKRELLAWEDVTDLPAEKRGNFIALSLPNKSDTFGNDIRERVLEHISTDELKSADGFKKVLEFLDSELGKDAISDITEKWDAFEDCRRGSGQPLDEFISEFELKCKRVEATGTKLPEEIKAHMLMKRAGLSNLEKMLVFSRVDRNKKKEMYKNVKTHLVSIIGSCMKKEEEMSLKLEPAFLAQHEEVLAAHGYFKGKATYNKSRFQKNKNENAPKYDSKKDKNGRPVNPKGQDGKYLTCRACGSFRHMVKDCQHSYENSQAHVAEDTDDSASCHMTQQVEDFEIDRFVLFTSNKDELSKFTSEAINAAAMDTCCTSSVAGEKWLDLYLKSIPKDMLNKVRGPFESKRSFQFGNQAILKSLKKYMLPARIAGLDTSIECDVISSDIPMLLSKPDMKRLGVTLHMLEDQAKINGMMIDLQTTSAGHYVLPLFDSKCHDVDVDEVFAVNLMIADDKEKLSALNKLHKQFGHRPKESFIKLLKSANSWSSEMAEIIDGIIDGCEGCIKRRRNPDKPAVSMPMASEFNEKVAIDLSFYKGNIILHIVDMWSRLTVSTLLRRKTPSEVTESIMQNWIAYYGVPRAILNDNGGEFTSEEIREVKSLLNVQDLTTGAESPWQNGLCEKNHALLDNILERLDEDFPEVQLQTKLAWAGMAKNSLQMVYGYSPNQLVFGQNPRLPNITSDGPPSWEEKTASEMVAKHLNTLHAARKAFIQSESSSRLKTALKSKIRTNSELYDYGDIVYYKRMKDDRWLGPARVIFQDGKIIFVRHGSTYIRVSANRIVKAGKELASKLDSTSLPKLGEVDKSSLEETSSLSKLEPVQDTHEAPQIELLEDNRSEHPSNHTTTQGNDILVPPMAVPTVSEKNSQKINLHKNDKIRYLDGEEWKEAIIVGRGKTTGQYKNWFNVAPTDGSEKHSVNLEKVQYEHITEEVHMVMVPRDEHYSKQCIEAKEAELDKLKEFDTYKVVEDLGQERISSTWVLSKKGDDIRARLVARGYEEQDEIQSDSPTLSKAGMRLIATFAATQKWTIETTDIKSAFLQGSQLNRKVYLKPPKEAGLDNKLWELTKALYGLKDASRQWYFRVKEKLLQLGCKQSKLDPGMFYKYDSGGNIAGIIGLHVDDFLHAGDAKFNITVIEEVNKEFKVGKNEKQNFVYTGFEFNQGQNGIILNQNNYVKNVETKPICAGRALKKQEDLTEEERTNLRQMAGSLNWIVRGTRPDLSFELIDISTKFRAGKVEDLMKINKLLAGVKESRAEIFLPNLEDIESCCLISFTDASLGNLNSGTDSTGGYLVFLVNQTSGNAAILDWQSNKVRRVVRSTLAAETLSLCEGLEAAIYLNGVLKELTGMTVDIHAFIDNRSAVDAIRSTTSVDDKRLRRDISAIKQMLERGEVKTVHWVPGDQQLADVLTKRGVNGLKLLEVLHSGRIDYNILHKLL